jgi:hypothetical protein
MKEHFFEEFYNFDLNNNEIELKFYNKTIDEDEIKYKYKKLELKELLEAYKTNEDPLSIKTNKNYLYLNNIEINNTDLLKIIKIIDEKILKNDLLKYYNESNLGLSNYLILIGVTNSMTVPHEEDYEAWSINFLLKGKKLWMYPKDKKILEYYKNCDFYHKFLLNLEMFENCDFYYFIQEEQQIVITPSLIHMVINLQDSICISRNFVTNINELKYHDCLCSIHNYFKS